MNYLFVTMVMCSYFYPDKGMVTQCIYFSNFFRIAAWRLIHSKQFPSDGVKQKMDTSDVS